MRSNPARMLATAAKGAWDYEKLIQIVPGKDAFIAPEESACPLLKK